MVIRLSVTGKQQFNMTCSKFIEKVLKKLLAVRQTSLDILPNLFIFLDKYKTMQYKDRLENEVTVYTPNPCI